MTRKPKAPQTIDGRTFTVLPTPRRIDLKSLEQVRAEMGRVYREMRGGKLETQDGTRLVYVLSQIGKMIELSDLEQRLERLENKHDS